MKTSTIKPQDNKKSIWHYLSRHFGKSFWILTILSVSCSANMAASSALPLADGGLEAKVAFSPDQVDFGIMPLGSSSAGQSVTLRNDGPAPLLIEDISVSKGFSITANSCPQSPKAVASHGTCTVEVIFEPNLAQNWVGYLRARYDSARTATIQLKGSARSGMEMLAYIIP